MSKPRPVHVTWLDAFDCPAKWVGRAELGTTPATVDTVGWLIKPDVIPDHLTVVTSIVHGETYGGGIHIPRACVVKVRKL